MSDTKMPPDQGPRPNTTGSTGPAVPNRADSAERFLRTLAKVLHDRTLYPAQHPQTLMGMQMLGAVIPDLFRERPERTVVVIDDQIFVDDRLLGGRGT
ncbi:MAG TPA: hypothetical protein VFN94_07590, partial [Nitrospiria bacterium]|nr:hypothetical protein [Nitrospiria bacterium]